MKRVRGKLLTVMLLGILATAVLVGGISILSLQEILQLDSDSMLARSTREFAEAVNAQRDRLIFFIIVFTLAVCIIVIVISVGIFRRIFEMAYTDELTKVGSQNAFQEESAEREQDIHRGRANFGICVFDVNHLKAVNDLYGHPAGDLLLMQAASLIQQHFPDEKVFRIGGDEFAIVFRGRPRYFVFSMLTTFRKRMRSSVSRDIRIPVVASGLAVYEEERDAAFQDVFSRADQAMYEDKLALKALDPEEVREQNRERL